MQQLLFFFFFLFLWSFVQSFVGMLIVWKKAWMNSHRQGWHKTHFERYKKSQNIDLLHLSVKRRLQNIFFRGGGIWDLFASNIVPLWSKKFRTYIIWPKIHQKDNNNWQIGCVDAALTILTIDKTLFIYLVLTDILWQNGSPGWFLHTWQGRNMAIVFDGGNSMAGHVRTYTCTINPVSKHPNWIESVPHFIEKTG